MNIKLEDISMTKCGMVLTMVTKVFSDGFYVFLLLLLLLFFTSNRSWNQ